MAELDARPLLHLLPGCNGIGGEVDAGDGADAPLGVGEAAGVAVDDRVVGHAAAERVVFGAVFGHRSRPLFGLVGAPARLLALTARGGGADFDGVRRDFAAARALCQALELVGGLVDRLEVALVLELASLRGHVRVPALGHAPTRKLHVALCERRLQLQQEQMLLDVEDGGGHDPTTLARADSFLFPLSCVRMSSQYVFTMHRLSKVHPPDKTVLDNVTLAFYPGAKIGVLGYNGAGKSTLLRIMAGVEEEYRGEAALAPGATVGMLEQEPHLDASKDVKGNVEDGVAETKALLDRFNELAANYSDETADEFGKLQAKIEAADAWNLDTQLEYAMDALRLPPPDADVSTLSGGERRRVALCRLLLRAPDLLLLDEPTNHLDAESVAWLEQHLSEYKGAIVAVTHDRYFLDNVAGWILELDRGKGIPYQGNYSSWLEQKQARMAQEERSEKGRERTIAAELEWVRTNPKGKRTKSKARLARYEELIAEDRNIKLDEVQIHIPPGPRLGAKVLTATDVSKGFGDRLLIESLSFELPRAGIVGVIGANGAGKTTLFRMITGTESPDSGKLEFGRHRRARLRRPVARLAESREDRLGGDLRRLRAHQSRRARGQLAPVHRRLQLQGQRPAGAHRQALRRRAQPRAPRQAAAQRWQPAAAGRAHQRS